ncbi:unnamed protein product [Musa acuminata var. zebrina]
MEPADKITGISIGAASCVNSIKITFDIDGTTRVTPRYGGPGGELFQFTLMQDEYLTSVSGYVKHDCSEFPCVSQLTFTTNLAKTYGPYGGGGGTFFEVNVEYDEIKGFFGHATEEYLTAFGVYIKQEGSTIADYLQNINIIIDNLALIGHSLSDKQVAVHILNGLEDEYKELAAAIWASLTSYLSACGIQHLKSPLHTLQLVGSAERKHRYIVETGLTLLHQASMPTTFWSIAFQAAVYLINRSIVLFQLNVFFSFVFYFYQILLDITLASLFIMAHIGWLSQHHVDSKFSEILCSCLSEETLNLVIFYVDFKKGSTPTSIWTVCLSKIGGKRELRDAWKFRTVVFDIPRNGG